MEHNAEYLAVLADKMSMVPSRGGALFQNIQNGGRQSLTSLSKPTLKANLAAKVGLPLYAHLRTCVWA